MAKKVEKFIQVTHGEPDDGTSVWLNHEKEAESLGAYFINNLELGDTATVKCIKGIRQKDPTGNYEYTVKEVKS